MPSPMPTALFQVRPAINSLVAAIALALPSSVQAANLVFLMAGEGNLAGGGQNSELTGSTLSPLFPPFDSPQPNVRFWNYGQPINGNNDPGAGTDWIDNQPGLGKSTAEFGPELSFGYEMHMFHPQDTIYLVKYGQPDTSLAADWNPSGAGNSYDQFQMRVAAALQHIASPVLAGMIWMQGDSDAASAAFAAAYQANLLSLISAVRSDFAAPTLQIAIAQITKNADSFPSGGNALVRAAQGSIGLIAPHMTLITTDDLDRAAAGYYDTSSQIELGYRLADGMFVTRIIPEPSSIALAISALIVIVVERARAKARARS